MILFSSIACTDEGPAFHSLGKGVAFRRVSLGDGDVKVSVGEGVGVSYRLTLTDTGHPLLAKDSSYFLLDDKDGVWTTMLSSMTKGDSSIFIIDRERLPSGGLSRLEGDIPDTLQKVRLEVKLLERRSPSALLEWKAEHAAGSLDKGRWKEWERIKAFVQGMAKDPQEHFVEGIYLFPERRGRGPKVEKGRTVEFHYRGYLPDSTVFDDSYKREEPMRFRFGAPKQVIPGLEIGLRYMREGGKAELVIPSYLAFGKKGGETGVLPPHTFVLYEVEVLEVKGGLSTSR